MGDSAITFPQHRNHNNNASHRISSVFFYEQTSPTLPQARRRQPRRCDAVRRISRSINPGAASQD